MTTSTHPWPRGASRAAACRIPACLRQVLKSIRAGMPGTAKAITDVSGKRSFSKFRTVDPAFASAVDIGLAWDSGLGDGG